MLGSKRQESRSVKNELMSYTVSTDICDKTGKGMEVMTLRGNRSVPQALDHFEFIHSLLRDLGIQTFGKQCILNNVVEGNNHKSHKIRLPLAFEALITKILIIMTNIYDVLNICQVLC